MPAGFTPDPVLNGFPVSGFDWADGVTVDIGTPTPADSFLIQLSPSNNSENNSYIEELPDSPEVDIGEVATISHRFRCDWETGSVYAQGLSRGSLMIDSFGNISSLLNIRLQRLKGNSALLAMTAELVLDPPPDEYSVDPVEFNLALEKHPRYRDVLNYNLNPDGTQINEESPTGYQIIQNIKTSAVNPQLLYRSSNLGWLNEDSIPGFDEESGSIPNTTLGQLIFELLNRYWRNETEFYLSGWQIHWSFFYFGFGQYGLDNQPLLPLDEGGYIQDPVASGFLPPYFWSLNGAPDYSFNNNNLQQIPYTDAIDLYGDPANGVFKWLRQADSLSFNRVWFRQTLSWVGAPLGTWDAAIYPFWNGSGLSWNPPG